MRDHLITNTSMNRKLTDTAIQRTTGHSVLKHQTSFGTKKLKNFVQITINFLCNLAFRIGLQRTNLHSKWPESQSKQHGDNPKTDSWSTSPTEKAQKGFLKAYAHNCTAREQIWKEERSRLSQGYGRRYNHITNRTSPMPWLLNRWSLLCLQYSK